MMSLAACSVIAESIPARAPWLISRMTTWMRMSACRAEAKTSASSITGPALIVRLGRRDAWPEPQRDLALAEDADGSGRVCVQAGNHVNDGAAVPLSADRRVQHPEDQGRGGSALALIHGARRGRRCLHPYQVDAHRSPEGYSRSRRVVHGPGADVAHGGRAPGAIADGRPVLNQVEDAVSDAQGTAAADLPLPVHPRDDDSDALSAQCFLHHAFAVFTHTG